MRDNIAVVGGDRSLVIFRKENGVWRFKDEIFRPDSGPESAWHGGTQRYQDGFVVAEAVNSDGPGAVYVFELGPSAKVQRTIRLAPSDSQAGDGFGAGIGMAKNTLVIGAPGVSKNGIKDVGAAYVFERQSGEWVETQKLTAINGSLNDGFGSTVALNKGLLLIAARGANRVFSPSHAFEQGGVVYAFRQVNGRWKERTRFRPSIQDFSHYTDFGLKIVMFGERAIISATEVPFVGLGGVVAFEYRFPTSGYLPVSFVRGTSPGGIALNQETLIIGVPSESRDSGIGHADVYDLGLPPE